MSVKGTVSWSFGLIFNWGDFDKFVGQLAYSVIFDVLVCPVLELCDLSIDLDNLCLGYL